MKLTCKKWSQHSVEQQEERNLGGPGGRFLILAGGKRPRHAVSCLSNWSSTVQVRQAVQEIVHSSGGLVLPGLGAG